MKFFWNTFFYQPVLSALVFFYKLLGENFGLAIIGLTLAIRGVLVPLTLPALKSSRALQNLKPELESLKRKYKKDRKRLQEEQLKLYKKHGINPASGCLPYLVQFLLLIALYRVFIHFIQTGTIDGMPVKMEFLWLNLSKPDPFFILPVLAGLSQLVLSLMVTPSPSEIAEIEEKAREPKKRVEDTEEMMMSMQKQMIFVMPMMTVLIGTKLPSGLALYWVVTMFFSILQQFYISGLGGLRPYLKKLGF